MGLVFASGLIGWRLGIVSPEMLAALPLPFSMQEEVWPAGQAVGSSQDKGPTGLVPFTSTTTAAATTTSAPLPTTTEESHNCELETPEVGDRIQAATDIMFQPAAMVPRGTYGNVIQLLTTGPSHDLSVIFDGFPQLKNASVRAYQLTQAVQPGDRVKAANDLRRSEGGAPAVPKDAVGTVVKVLPPSADGWEVFYRVNWDRATLADQDLPMKATRLQIYKVDAWPPHKTVWCCTYKNVSCPENCATNDTWSDQKRAWCCEHHGQGCETTTATSTSSTTLTTSTTTTWTTYNCYMQDVWTEGKAKWCCKTQGLGCQA
jgi:hypothetical protein